MKILPIKILLLVIFPSLIFAQGIETSPYSAFGLGEDKYEGPAGSLSMGGLNSIYWDNVHTNPSNPATYSFLSLTNFTFGGQGQVTNLKTASESEQNQEFGVNQLVIGIPMGKWGAAIGFMPISSTGYELTHSDKLTNPSLAVNHNELPYDGSYSNIYKFDGNGGMNRFFIGTSYSPFKGFSVGVNANYEFGNLNRSVRMITPLVYHDFDKDETTPSTVVFEGSMYGTKEVEALKIRDWSFLLGTIYTGDIKENLQFSVGATYGLGKKVDLDYSRYLYTFTLDGSSGREIPKDTLANYSGNYKLENIKLPANGSVGVSVGKYSKWMIGVNYEFQDANDLSFGNENYNVEYTQNKKYSIGGYITPKYNSLMSYLEKITYRAGFNYEEVGLKINGTDIVDYSVNFGLGLPMGNGASSINIGGSFGSRGTIEDGLIKEDYFTFFVSFSLSDKWFKKVKYN